MKKKKKGCLRRIFGWIAKAFGLLIVLSFIASLGGDKEPQGDAAPAETQAVLESPEPTSTPAPTSTPKPTATPTPKPTATPTQEPTATPTQEPTATPTQEPTQAPTATPIPTNTPEPTPEPLVMPGIGGSNAYDVVLSLADLGVTKPETTHIDGGYQWSSNIVTFGATSVVYDIVANRDHEICHATFNLSGKDNGFLTYCATLPYDTADKDAATAFVAGHMTGESASITIGDALFTMTARNGGATLIIEDVDADAYYDAKITESLGI